MYDRSMLLCNFFYAWLGMPCFFPHLTHNGMLHVYFIMVGLPASGKFTNWAERWVNENLEKRYILLGTNLALDQMKVCNVKPSSHKEIFLSCVSIHFF